jgi:hypothetical protein
VLDGPLAGDRAVGEISIGRVSASISCTWPAPTMVLGMSVRPSAVASSRLTEAATGSSYADCSSARAPETSAVA